MRPSARQGECPLPPWISDHSWTLGPRDSDPERGLLTDHREGKLDQGYVAKRLEGSLAQGWGPSRSCWGALPFPPCRTEAHGRFGGDVGVFSQWTDLIRAVGGVCGKCIGGGTSWRRKESMGGEATLFWPAEVCALPSLSSSVRVFLAFPRPQRKRSHSSPVF